MHHIKRWIDGGRTDPENLTTVCWFHHQVVIHGHGFTIDPELATPETATPPPPNPRPTLARTSPSQGMVVTGMVVSRDTETRVLPSVGFLHREWSGSRCGPPRMGKLTSGEAADGGGRASTRRAELHSGGVKQIHDRRAASGLESESRVVLCSFLALDLCSLLLLLLFRYT